MRKISFAIQILFLIHLTGCNEEQSKVTISTPTIQCGMCQKTIEMGLSKVKGISNSVVDLKTKTATVAYSAENIDLATIENAISDLGYQANDLVADPVAYEALVACCKIGGMN